MGPYLRESLRDPRCAPVLRQAFLWVYDSARMRGVGAPFILRICRTIERKFWREGSVWRKACEQ
jgi:hypothetical protein